MDDRRDPEARGRRADDIPFEMAGMTPSPDRYPLQQACFIRILCDLTRRTFSGRYAVDAQMQTAEIGFLPGSYFDKVRRGNVHLHDLTALKNLENRCRQAEREMEGSFRDDPAQTAKSGFVRDETAAQFKDIPLNAMERDR